MTDETQAIEQPETGGAIVAFDYGQDAGGGFQNQTQDDIQIPILGIIQDMSPQTKKSKPEYIEGASVGMLFNPVTEELIKGEVGILFVPSVTDHCFIEWRDRDDGGGYVARHELDSAAAAQFRAFGGKPKDYRTADGNELLETFYVYGIRVDTPVPQPMILAMSRSKIRVYRKWNTKIRQHMIDVGDGRKQNPPMYANLVRITTFEDQNDKGDVFMNFVLAPAKGTTLAESLLPPNHDLFLSGKKIGELFTAGHAKADYATENPGTSGDSDVPF